MIATRRESVGTVTAYPSPVLTILDGNRFLVCDDLGDVEGGADGLYSDDTRHLSRWRMLLDGRRPKLLSSGLRDHASAVVYAQHDVRLAVAALAARGRPRAVRLGRLVPGAARAREPRHRAGGRSSCATSSTATSSTCSRSSRRASASATSPSRRRSRRCARRAASTRATGSFVFDADGGGFAADVLDLVLRARRPGRSRAATSRSSLPPRLRAGRSTSRCCRARPRTARRSAARPSCSASACACATRSSGSRDRCPTLESSAPGLAQPLPPVADRPRTRCACAHGGARPTRELVAAGLPWFMAPFGRDTADLVVPDDAARRRPRARRAARAGRPPGAPTTARARRRARQDPARDALRQGGRADRASSRTTARSTRRCCT